MSRVECLHSRLYNIDVITSPLEPHVAVTSSVLYGRRITRQCDAPLPDQLYTILQREILRGRWKAGERIPSHKSLAESTGLSQAPIQATIQRLAADGYVERVRHKGVFVKSVDSAGNRGLALRWTLEALLRAPLGRGRLALSLLLAMLLGQSL